MNSDLTYAAAIVKMSLLMDLGGKVNGKKVDAFTASALLAYLFDLPKEDTIKALINYRNGLPG